MYEKGEVVRRYSCIFAIAAAALLVSGGSSALAAKPGSTCAGGTITGTYGSVTVTGNCQTVGDVTINGDLTIADGAVLNNHASGSPYMFENVIINGNIQVGKGAVLGLGSYGGPGIRTHTVVNGNINANQPLDLYLSGITVHGSVNSNGGGPGASQFLNFPTKDNTIDGNLIVQGWTGGWIGALRNTVGGNLDFSKNSTVVHETPDGCGEGTAPACTSFAPGGDPDSSEVVDNVIGGNLICHDNSPAVQVGDTNGGPNTVSGNKLGECVGAGL